MNDERCMDCGILLSPDSNLCPVCGFDNSRLKQQDLAVNGSLSAILEDDFVPAYYPGY